jgi:hypothetical protein
VPKYLISTHAIICFLFFYFFYFFRLAACFLPFFDFFVRDFVLRAAGLLSAAAVAGAGWPAGNILPAFAHARGSQAGAS